ncbi:hypothetical protein [Frigoribacterium sp. CG_9.8]|uniref:hypothetical protein n=1 Tax=Frigoribacterium sp. CG_9.8 TaxID=2787733 RepID=UPI0018CA298C|nr:hypothetical protein [Frigoribacterium sp. CG_9.8]MBG6106600.1 hypothetical protein [Frigoribacterium sp. CG_9.8]
MPDLTGYWAKYDTTLKRIRDEKPKDLAELKVILDDFEPPSSGVAFFPNAADDQLDDALIDAGWRIHYIESDYLWEAKSPTGSRIHFTEGDVHDGPWAPWPKPTESETPA